MPTPAQIRAARSFVDLQQVQLAAAVGISKNAMMAIEKGRAQPRSATVSKIVQALQAEGVEFTDDGGVRPRARP
jgi:predicted transcriptional regulator